MNTPSSRIRIQTFQLPKPGNASIEELQRRAATLRRAILQETELRRIFEAFTDDFMTEPVFVDRSRRTDNAPFAAVVGAGGLLDQRYPGERFETATFHCTALGLFHGPLLSPHRIGCAFHFAGDETGVIALSPFADGSSSDFFRYSFVRKNSVRTRGGSA